MCGIIILNYNTPKETIECIESVKKKCVESHYRIYLIDNASTDDSVDIFEKEYNGDADIRIIVSKENLGYSGGNNLGIKSSLDDNCDYVFIVNSDIVLKNDAISIMRDCLKKNKDVLVAGPSVYLKDGTYSQFARKPLSFTAYQLEKKPWSILLKDKSRRERFYEYDIDKNYVFGGMTAGCCIGFKREYFERFGLLDENIFLFYEEDVIAHLLCRSQKRAMICADAKVIHNEGTSMSKTDEGRLLITRLYRWPTSIYVLNRYADVNCAKCLKLDKRDHIIWKLLGLFKKAYRNSYDKYDGESKRLMKLSR